MKKIAITLLVISSLISCSKSDDNSSNTQSNSGFCEISINGQTHRNEFDEGYSFSYVGTTDNCGGTDNLTFQNVEQFSTSSFFLDLGLLHNEFLNNFNGYNLNNSVVKDDFDYNVCYNNFDFIANYFDEVEQEYLILNSTSSNTNTIQSITQYSEDSQEIIYSVNGSFSVTYKKVDNSLLPVTGNYRFFIYVTK